MFKDCFKYEIEIMPEIVLNLDNIKFWNDDIERKYEDVFITSKKNSLL